MTQVLRKRNEFKIPGCSRSFIDRIIKLFWRDLDDVVLVQIITKKTTVIYHVAYMLVIVIAPWLSSGCVCCNKT